MSEDKTKPIKITLEIYPHDMEQLRARRFPHPDVRRLLDARWWTESLFGSRATRDPIPRILSVKADKRSTMVLENGGRESLADPEE